ncbi:unnamed protein product, partial [Ranitomeya imitator]
MVPIVLLPTCADTDNSTKHGAAPIYCVCMEPRGIVKAFPKVKRNPTEDRKKIKADVDIQGKCFAGVHAYVLLAGIGQARSAIFQKQIIQNGGQVYSQLCPEVTHIIVDEGMDCDRAFRLMKLQKLPAGVTLVKCSWLGLCINEKKLVNTAGYSIFIPERYLDVKDEGEPEQRHRDIVMDGKAGDEQASASCSHTQPTSDVSNLSDSKDLKVQVPDDETSDGEDIGVTQGDLDALMFGQHLSKNKDGEKATENSGTVTGKWVCAHSSESKKENHNQLITDKLEVLAKAYSVQGDRWRSLGYSKAINALKSYHKPVTSAQ